jgi:hypothetical protein
LSLAKPCAMADCTEKSVYVAKRTLNLCKEHNSNRDALLLQASKGQSNPTHDNFLPKYLSGLGAVASWQSFSQGSEIILSPCHTTLSRRWAPEQNLQSLPIPRPPMRPYRNLGKNMNIIQNNSFQDHKLTNQVPGKTKLFNCSCQC